MNLDYLYCKNENCKRIFSNYLFFIRIFICIQGKKNFAFNGTDPIQFQAMKADYKFQEKGDESII